MNMIWSVIALLMMPAAGCGDLEDRWKARKFDDHYDEQDAAISRGKQDDCQLGADAKYRLCLDEDSADPEESGEIEESTRASAKAGEVGLEASRHMKKPPRSHRPGWCEKQYKEWMQRCAQQ